MAKRQTKAEKAKAEARRAAAQKAAETRRRKLAEAEARAEARRVAARKAAATRKANARKAKRSAAAQKGAETKRRKAAEAAAQKEKRKAAARKGAETKRHKAVAAAKEAGQLPKPRVITYHAGIDYKNKTSSHGKTNLHVELAVKADKDQVKPEDLNRILQHYSTTGNFLSGVFDIKLLSWQHQHHAKQEPADEFEQEEVRRALLENIAPAAEFYPLGGGEGNG